MAKRALCVGINDYPFEDNDLKGCVNDAKAWRDLLVEQFAFPASDVTVVTDQDATRQAMADGLRGLIDSASEGDVLVFTNSSHGSYIRDDSGDEPTYDEVLCPHDSNQQLLTDDDVRALLDALPAGVSMTMISDSCYSGSVSRGDDMKLLPPEHRRYSRPRFLPTKFLPEIARGEPLPDARGTPPSGRIAYPESGMNHVLLSGCRDDQVSWDTEIDGVYHGAMSYHAIKAIRDAGGKLTYAELAARLQPMLDAARYEQHPQLEGPEERKQRLLFM